MTGKTNGHRVGLLDDWIRELVAPYRKPPFTLLPMTYRCIYTCLFKENPNGRPRPSAWHESSLRRGCRDIRLRCRRN